MWFWANLKFLILLQNDVRLPQASTGYHLATDDDCKAQEMSGRSLPVQPKDGWCVPLRKESYTKTADSGVWWKVE